LKRTRTQFYSHESGGVQHHAVFVLEVAEAIVESKYIFQLKCAKVMDQNSTADDQTV
jgi:hypothetical protein